MSLTKNFNIGKTAFSSFFFPSVCLHCQGKVEESERAFCQGCTSFFELLSIDARCKGCFCEWGKRGLCPSCRQKKQWKVELAAALAYEGPVASLVKRLKQGSSPYLAKTAAAWMAVQFEMLGWPLPDALVPIPCGFLKSLWMGKDHAYLIAEALSIYLKVPVIQPLLKNSAVRPQGKLSRKQRLLFPPSAFYLKKKPMVVDKTLLLVDDVMTTGTTLRLAAEKLREGFPRKIYAMTFAYSGHSRGLCI